MPTPNIYIYIFVKNLILLFGNDIKLIKSDSKYFHVVTKNYSKLLIKESRKKMIMVSTKLLSSTADFISINNNKTTFFCFLSMKSAY